MEDLFLCCCLSAVYGLMLILMHIKNILIRGFVKAYCANFASPFKNHGLFYVI